MKRIFTFLVSALLVASTAQAQTNTFYPGLTAADSSRVYQAPKATTPIVIDGNPADAAWQLAPWKSAMGVSALDADWTITAPGTPADKEGAFSGVEDANLKYKIVWDDNHYYILFRLVDDNIVYSSKHGGYQKGRIPAYATGLTFPLAGGGDGSVLHAWRLDQLQFWLTPYTTALADGTPPNYGRANDGVWHSFFPGRVNPSNTEEPGVLWSATHNTILATDLEQTHNATAAISYNQTEKAHYIEFRDTTWIALLSTVRNKATAWNTLQYAPKVGDKFLMQGEYNDADGITNRRDYQLSLGWLYNIPNRNSLNNLKQAITIELVETVSGVKNPKANNSLEMYPNVTAGNTISLSRVADVQIFNLSGRMMMESKNSAEINISGLKQGVYLLKDNDGNVNKLIRQ